MSELARRLAGTAPQEEGVLARLLRGLGRAAQSGVDDMNAALSGYRVKPGAVLTDAGYVMPEDLARGNYDSATEREPDTLRALTLFGGAMTPARGAGIAAKAGAEAKAAASAAHALPMDEASRMQRAKDLGYTVDAYHGTAPSPQWNTLKELDQQIDNYAGFNAFNGGSYFATNPAYASGFADAQAAERAFGNGANVMPVKLKVKNPYDARDDADFWKKLRASPDAVGGPIREAGHDSILMRETDRPDMIGDVYYVFDPSNIRSRFAAFDPAKTDSADLLASYANMGPLANSLLPRRDQR